MSSSPKGCRFRFPDWLPQPARQRITELIATPDGEGDFGGALLVRLATYPAMKTEVWEKLPLEPKDIEGKLIDQAFLAYTIFPKLLRPHPKTRRKWLDLAQHREKHAPLTNPFYLSQLSIQLWGEIYKCKLETKTYWAPFWKGDPNIEVDKVLSVLDQLSEFYARMDAEYRSLLDTLPPVNRWNANAHQKFFTECLSRYMKQTYGQPHDSTVAALAEVAIDLPQGVGSETVRGRRRLGKAPENWKQKTR